jgi:hypothetical protein
VFVISSRTYHHVYPLWHGPRPRLHCRLYFPRRVSLGLPLPPKYQSFPPTDTLLTLPSLSAYRPVAASAMAGNSFMRSSFAGAPLLPSLVFHCIDPSLIHVHASLYFGSSSEFPSLCYPDLLQAGCARSKFAAWRAARAYGVRLFNPSRSDDRPVPLLTHGPCITPL